MTSPTSVRKDVVSLLAEAATNAMTEACKQSDATPSELVSAIFSLTYSTIGALKKHGVDMTPSKEAVGRMLLECDDLVTPTPKERLN